MRSDFSTPPPCFPGKAITCVSVVMTEVEIVTVINVCIIPAVKLGNFGHPYQKTPTNSKPANSDFGWIKKFLFFLKIVISIYAFRNGLVLWREGRGKPERFYNRGENSCFLHILAKNSIEIDINREGQTTEELQKKKKKMPGRGRNSIFQPSVWRAVIGDFEIVRFVGVKEIWEITAGFP